MSQKINVPLLDLHAQYRTIKPEIEKVTLEVLASQQFILGPKVTECAARPCGAGVKTAIAPTSA